MLPYTFLFPFIVMVKNGVVWGKVMRQMSPLAACSQPIKDGVDDFTKVNCLVSPFADFGRNECLEDIPLVVGEVGGIGFTSPFDYNLAPEGKSCQSIAFQCVWSNTNFQTTSESWRAVSL